MKGEHVTKHQGDTLNTHHEFQKTSIAHGDGKAEHTAGAGGSANRAQNHQVTQQPNMEWIGKGKVITIRKRGYLHSSTTDSTDLAGAYRQEC